MNVWKKIGALTFVLIVALALSVSAFATSEAELTGGVSGAFTNTDTFAYENNKTVKIAKEITAYNLNETAIAAPTISYTYSIAAGDSGQSITDAATLHDPELAVTRTTEAGVITDVTMAGTSANTIAWTTSDNLTAASNGEANTKYLTIDFSNVVFSKPGVYRYVLTEALTSDYTYASSGVTETTETSTKHIRYLDVYVKAASGYTTGMNATDWDIYGYVCMATNPASITTSTVDDAVKTNGFVARTGVSADSYYTFNVIVSKTLTGDNYSNSHEFPMHIDFTNATVTQNVLLKATADSGATDYTHSEGAVSSLDGLAKIATGKQIKYIGIPCGTQVDVYETNDVNNTTYATTLTVDGTAGTAKSISSTTTPGAFAEYAEQVYNSNKGTITTTANQTDSKNHTIAVVNAFKAISPTGVTLRYAPYFLTLGAGVVALPLTRSYRRREED